MSTGKRKTTFGERLRSLRKRADLSTQAVANACQVAESTYREWEYGRNIRGVGPYETLAKLFEVSLPELILGDRGSAASIDEDLRHIEKIVRTIRVKLQ